MKLSGKFPELDLSETECKFVDCFDEELKEFENDKKQESALILPSLHKRFRFLIHKVAEYHPSLHSFSIGEGWYRRTVICYENAIFINVTKQKRSRLEMDAKKRTPKERNRRPDIQVYVPRARRAELQKEAKKNVEIKVKPEVLDRSNDMKQDKIADEQNGSCVAMPNDQSNCTSGCEITSQVESKESVVPAIESKDAEIDIEETNDMKIEECVVELPEEIHDEASETICDVSNNKANFSLNETDNDDGEVDGDSWDALFDDSGDCLNPDQLKELDDKLGKVKLKTPKINYLEFTPHKPETLDSEEFQHVLEIYNFPAEFKTHDLMVALSQFKDKGFEIKWVDDTHALAVFCNANAALAALSMNHALIKMRPLSEAIDKSKQKARHCSEFLLPYKQRPETSSALARRLVAGALGLQSKMPRQKQLQEMRQLKEAREKKKMTAKQKQDIWDGKV